MRMLIPSFGCMLALAPAAAMAAEPAPRICIATDQMDGLALLSDDTIVVTMRGRTHKRLDLTQCAGLTKSPDLAFSSTATSLCEQTTLPVTPAPTGCAIQKIADLTETEAAALLPQPATASYDDLSKESQALKAEQARKRQAVSIDPVAFDKFVGSYQIDLDVFVEVGRKDKHFSYRVTNEKPVEVFPESDTKFFAKSVPAQISFVRAAPDAAFTLILNRNGEVIVARRVADADAKSAEATLIKRMVGLKPDPEREQLLRRYLEASQSNTVPADILSPPLLAYTQQQWSTIQETNRQMGKRLMLRFAGYSPTGADQFRVFYEHGTVLYTVGSLTTDHKLLALVGVRNKPDCPARCGCSETTISAKDTWKPIALVTAGDEIQIKTERRYISSSFDSAPLLPGMQRTSDPEVWAKLGGGSRDPLQAALEDMANALSQPSEGMLIDSTALDPASPVGINSVLGKIGSAQFFMIDPGSKGAPFANGTSFNRIAERSGPLFIIKNNSGQPSAPDDKTILRVRVCYRGDVTVLPLETDASPAK